MEFIEYCTEGEKQKGCVVQSDCEHVDAWEL